MKVVIQRSKSSSVSVNGVLSSSIESGLVLLVCMEQGDDKYCLQKASEKILKIRLFSDEEGKMNKSILETKGEILSISQFTLSWDGQKGNRPSFDKSMKPQEARQLFEEFNALLSKEVVVKTGEFGEHMDVKIHNDGPVTFALKF